MRIISELRVPDHTQRDMAGALRTAKNAGDEDVLEELTDILTNDKLTDGKKAEMFLRVAELFGVGESPLLLLFCSLYIQRCLLTPNVSLLASCAIQFREPT